MESIALIAELERALPGFGDYYSDPTENLFDSGTLCAVFSACSSFVRERPVAAESWPLVADILNRAAASPDENLAEAACACFLENLADTGHPLRRFLEGKALEFWVDWEPAG
jgi:hypothetical protein